MVRRTLLLATLVVFSCAHEESEVVQLELSVDESLWFSYMLHDVPPKGTGWMFTNAKRCGDMSSFSRPGLAVRSSHLNAGNYQIVDKVRAHDYFTGQQFASVFVSDKLNPFSAEESSARLKRGSVLIEPLPNPSIGQESDLQRDGVVRVSFKGIVVPDEFRPLECTEKSKKDASHSVVKCACKNARGIVERCKLEINGDGSELEDVDKTCCDQLNPSSPNEVIVEGSFQARYCNEFCASSSPSLLQYGCPSKK